MNYVELERISCTTFPSAFHGSLSYLSYKQLKCQGRESSSFVTRCCYTFIICLKKTIEKCFQLTWLILSLLAVGSRDVLLSCDTAVTANPLRMSSYSNHRMWMATAVVKHAPVSSMYANMVDNAWTWLPGPSAIARAQGTTANIVSSQVYIPYLCLRLHISNSLPQ